MNTSFLQFLRVERVFKNGTFDQDQRRPHAALQVSDAAMMYPGPH